VRELLGGIITHDVKITSYAKSPLRFTIPSTIPERPVQTTAKALAVAENILVENKKLLTPLSKEFPCDACLFRGRP